MKKLAGNPGKRALNNKEPKPEKSKVPSAPSHLNAVASREWKRIAKELHRLGVLTQLDRAALAAYCSAYADYVKAEKELTKSGEVINSSEGNAYQSPWMGIKKRSMDQMIKFGTEFGLTPSSRVRIKADGADPEEEKEARLFPHAGKGTKK